MDIAALREDYRRAGIAPSDLHEDPLEQLRAWLGEAIQANIAEPTGMTLATAEPEGLLRARTVLLKEIDARGLVFFTNLESRKSRHLQANSVAALSIWWQPLERQVQVAGRAEQVDDAAADAYFATRPRESQIGAWASPQSQVISGREELERRARQVEQRYGDGAIPRPPHWGGYRVVPADVEFWQGRPGRLHDRVRYSRDGDRAWAKERLAP